MRATLRRLATEATSLPMPMSLNEASIQLVPPISLYRRLLRAHRHLPLEMRFMGDSYIKSEFRLTRTTDNPLHIIAFLRQWKHYLDELEQAHSEGNGQPWRGKRLDEERLDQMTKEQVGQLYELMHATKDVWKSTDQLEEEAKEARVDVDGHGSSSDSTKKHS